MQNWSVRFTMLPLLAASVAGCGSDAESRVVEQFPSQDGARVAKLMDERHFGPGTAGDIVSVTLNRRGEKSPAGDILVLEANEPYPGHPERLVSVQWRSPTQLTVHFRHATADTIVQRFAGIDIATIEDR